MTPIPFVKMHGAANDFIVIDGRGRESGGMRTEWIATVCDRRRGVGADGLLLLEPAPGHDFAMRYWNRDGQPAEFCGNGARCIARFALDLGIGSGGTVRFTTAVGPMSARREADDRIALAFGRIERAGEPLTLEAAGRRFTGRFVRAGVPHFVTPVPDLAAAPLDTWGRALRSHPYFGAEGVNVDLVEPRDRAIAMRTFERGVEGETLACGSGAMAVALWQAAEGAGSPVSVRTAGGDTLSVAFAPRDGAWDVTLIGPAVVAFTGVWDDAAHAAEDRA
jgi:diaminopimelate epimerase